MHSLNNIYNLVIKKVVLWVLQGQIRYLALSSQILINKRGYFGVDTIVQAWTVTIGQGRDLQDYYSRDLDMRSKIHSKRSCYIVCYQLKPW